MSASGLNRGGVRVLRAGLFAGILLLLGGGPAWAQNQKLAERAAMSRLKGQESAAVTVYEISDFQCPYCSRFARDVFPRIDSAYVRTGKAKWIFVNFPLPTHAHAWAASEAAMCAGAVSGKFWPMHDKLFVSQAQWSGAAQPAALFAQYAKGLGVPMPAYESCVANDDIATLLVRDLLNAAGAGVTGTPAFVVNNEPIFAGVRQFEEWKEILDTAIKKAAAK
jgi:protein-disulfide isomerase